MKADNSHILLKQIETNYLRYVDNVWKTIQFQLVAIGWFLTTKNWRDVVAERNSIQICLIVGILWLCISHIAIELRFHKESKRVSQRIQANFNSSMEEDTKHWRISRFLLSLNIGSTMFLFLLIILLIALP